MISSRFARWNLIGVTVALLIVFFWIDPTGRSATWARFIGRFHPGIVHLPVGILLFGLVLRVFRAPDAVINVALVTGSWAALLAVTAGSWLAQLGAYPADTLFIHKLLGYSAALLSSALLYARFEMPRPLLTGALWVMIAGSLVVAGDQGGVLTRGAGYTTEYAPQFIQNVLGHPDPMKTRFSLSKPDSVSVFESVIAPIFAEKCTSCHGVDRNKGSLRLNSAESIGDHNGDEPLIVAGQPSESLLIQRLSLPEGHDDQMPPPPNAKPISHADVELIKWWIAEGASFERSIAETPMTTSILTILGAYGLGEILTGIFALDVSPPDTTAINDLRAGGARVNALSIDTPFLSVRCESRSFCFDDRAREAINTLSQNITHLDLSNSDVTDADLSSLSSLSNLTRLDVSETDVTGTGLSGLTDLEFLAYLNLFGTRVEDEQVEILYSMPGLRAVYLWQTSVSEDAIARLASTLTEARINSGNF